MEPIRLLEKYFGTSSRSFSVVLQHSLLVAQKAVAAAKFLGDPSIDLSFVEEAALLHDIGVCETDSPGIGCRGSAPYVQHGIIGRRILEDEGLPLHALVCERHIGVGLTIEDIVAQELSLPLRDMVPVTAEERVIAYADLFFSKKGRENMGERTIPEVRRSLERFGRHKLTIFDRWVSEFESPISRFGT